MMFDYDAIVIGSGHNALTCALYLVRAGWRVLVLERASEAGGSLRSGVLTLPGFCHDLYATNVAQFAASQVYREFKTDFDAHGVKLLRSDLPYAGVDSTHALRIYTDRDRTLSEFRAISGADAEAWIVLIDFFKRTAPYFLPLFGSEMPSAEMWNHVKRAVRAGIGDSLRLGHLCLRTSHNLAAGYFESDIARALVASWAYHLDFAPTTPGGAVFAFVAAVSAHLFGAPTIEGGVGKLSTAFCALIEASGGRVVCGADVNQILTRQGKAVGVRTKSGDEYTAGRAVVANVTPLNLFTQLVPDDVLDNRFIKRVRRYRYGPGTFVIYLALDRHPEWALADDLSEFSYVHLNGSEAEIAATYKQSMEGYLPERPLLVVSQPSAIDASRAPSGKHAFRIHVRTVPRDISGDAGGTISGRTWREAGPAFAQRVIDQTAEHIPNLRASILATAIQTPEDIELNNPNCVKGDCVSGSHQLDQNFFFRPFFGWSRYQTPVENLYMIGAATWPGGGVNAGSGYLAARKLLQSN